MDRFLCVAAIVLLFVISSGCNGSGSPASGPLQTSRQSSDSPHSRALWGLYHCTMDQGSSEISVVPMRGAMFTANVNNILEGSKGNLLITDLDLNNFTTQGLLNCTVTLKHPFPGLDKYDGFDVWGVFMHNGSAAINYDGLTYANSKSGNNEAELLNADGYTRWFNQPEFDGNGIPLFEFWPGKLGNLQTPTATLNPFKIFADNLGNEVGYYSWIGDQANFKNRGIFKAGSANSRRYHLAFPIIAGAPIVDFQYAVIAGWEEADPTLTGDPSVYDPFDFPTSANVEEPFFLHASTVSSDLYNDGAGHSGGSFKADVEIFDWQGGSVGHTGVPNEVNRLLLEGNFLPGGKAEFSQAQLISMAGAASENSSVFQIDIPNCTPQAAGDGSFWMIAEASGLNGSSYGQGFPTQYPASARRAAFLPGTVPVSGSLNSTITVLSPNGGEIWGIGTAQNVTWTSTGSIANVTIDYSKDNFVSDIHSIVASTPNTGLYPWTIPDDPSTTVRVRVSDAANAAVFDTSDANFTIQSNATYWNQYMHDPSHGGRTGVDGPATNHKEWSYSSVGNNPLTVVEGFDGTIYFGSVSNGGRIEAVNPDGSKKWTYLPSVSSDWNKPLGVSMDNTVLYVGADTGFFDGKIFGVKTSDGTELWSYDCWVSSNTYGLILSNGDLVVAADDNPGGAGPYITVRITQNGAQVWKTSTGWNWCSSPAQGPDGTIYTKSNSTLLALDPDTGTQTGFYSIPPDNMQTSFAVRSDGSIVLATNTMVYCVSKTMSLIWQCSTPGGVMIDGFGIGANDEVYASNGSGTLFAIKANGALDWTYPGVAAWSAPAIGGDGTIYIGTNMGVAAISPAGSTVWSFNPGGAASQPIIAHDGSLYANISGTLNKIKDL